MSGGEGEGGTNQSVRASPEVISVLLEFVIADVC